MPAEPIVIAPFSGSMAEPIRQDLQLAIIACLCSWLSSGSMAEPIRQDLRRKRQHDEYSCPDGGSMAEPIRQDLRPLLEDMEKTLYLRLNGRGDP